MADDDGAATGTLGKAIATLSLVCEAEAPLRFTDILERSGQPRGTLHRQLTHLVAEGLLDIGRDQLYAPGLRLLSLAASAWSRNEMRRLAEPHLQALNALTGETVHLGVLRGSEIVYLDKVEGRQAIRMYSQIGRASPVYCTGIGKVALSVLAAQARAVLLERLDLRRFTQNTHTDLAALVREIEEIAQNGYGFDREEHEDGIHCVAAPIVSPDASLAGGVSVTAPSFRVAMAQMADWAPAVRDAGHTVSRDIAVRMSPRPAWG